MPFKKGVSGNPGGRPKTVSIVREGASALLPIALAKLHDLLSCGDPKVELAAAREIFDRGVGRAPQALETDAAQLERIIVETAVARAKLKLLEAGTDPDGNKQTINVIIPDLKAAIEGKSE